MCTPFRLPAIKSGIKFKPPVLLLGGKNLTYRWDDQVALQEKAIADSRTKTTINYYDVNGDFDNLSQTSNDLETEALAAPTQVGIHTPKVFYLCYSCQEFIFWG
jgi:hypothetical protein